MADEDEHDTETAAEVFARVEGELALLRRAVERLAIERAELPEQPDYSETLGRMAKAIVAAGERLEVLSKAAQDGVAPRYVADRIVAAGGNVRAEDQRTIATARSGLDEATRRLNGLVASAMMAQAQKRRLAWTAIGGVALGMLLWTAFAGVVARAAPESWHWPEKRAAWALDMSMWRAGGQLLATADPAAYRQIIADEQIARANHDTVARCERAAEKAGDVVRCTIRVGAER